MNETTPSATPTVLVVGCGFPQLGLIRHCRDLGLRTVGVDMNPRAVGVAYCDGFEEVSTGDVTAVAGAARKHGADGVVTSGSEMALRTAAEVCHALGLRFYAPPEVVDRCQSKKLMREAYAAGNAPSPQFDVVTDHQGPNGVPYPAVVKPARGWGQRGVRVVNNDRERDAALATALDIAGDLDRGNRAAIVEAWVPGREFSVNCYTVAGETTVLSVTERIITAPPDPPGITFAEVFPSGLCAQDEAEVVHAALAGLRSLGITQGPTYTQVRFGDQGAFLVETAHRPGGGLDPDVAELASGISMYRQLLGVALDRPAWEAPERIGPQHGGVIGKFLIGQPGQVVSVSGLDGARALPGIEDAQVYVREGETVHPLINGSHRIGHVLAVGRDRREAEVRAEAAATVIRVETRERTDAS